MNLSASLEERGLHAPADGGADIPLILPTLLPPDGTAWVSVREAVRGAARIQFLSGAASGAAGLVAAELATTSFVLAIAPDLEGARALGEDTGFFGADCRVLPIPETSPYADVAADKRACMARLSILALLATEDNAAARPRVIVLPAAGLVRKLIPKRVLRDFTFCITEACEYERDELSLKLGQAGYLRVPLVEDPGSFAFRGSLLDIWPEGRDLPTRIEFYGDMVLSLKAFDPSDQKTLPPKEGEKLETVLVPPAKEVVLTPEHVARAKERILALADAVNYPTLKTRTIIDDAAAGRTSLGSDGLLPAYYEALDSIFDYLPKDAVVLLDNPERIIREVRAELERAYREDDSHALTPHFPVGSFYLSEDDAAAALGQRRVFSTGGMAVLGESLDGLDPFASGESARALGSLDLRDLAQATKQARSQKGKGSALGPLHKHIAHYQDHGLAVTITARTEVQAERIKGLLRNLGVASRMALGAVGPAEHRKLASEGDVVLAIGSLSRGVILPAEGIVYVTEEELFGSRAKRARARRSEDKSRPFVADLSSLTPGDYVVHVDHGIGRYLGLVHRDVGGTKVDLLCVEYNGSDKLYLPVHRLNQIQKYAGSEGAEPKIDRLGGQTFAKTKGKVAKAVREMADQLLRLYAERERAVAEPFPEPGEDYATFEATFPFEETPDQAAAIAELNRDLERSRPMDRLVCGDVGFGKTEVALRGAFRAAISGRQVCVLCPTTVLAQQHFRTFENRMRDYPVNIRLISRFQSKGEQEKILAEVKEGKADILIGTHRLLSKDIHFKSLGLLVVDEEQRFGVTHKERIKQIKSDVHVLTLSATPIPRTLQMAISGLRDLSLITTAPADRRAVRTLVTRNDDDVIREAVLRELSRGGQVFYVYNRIEGIYERAERLQRLVPHARIAVGHGQLGGKASSDGESALEKTMLDFVEGRYDILVATAIIESGLDIPRANTMIIDRADMFGLAQLYQLRGRVGRAKERAYCYLVVPKAEGLTDEARARIEALEKHTELGSGFKIASLDLELRGAGDLLSGEQSGNVASVGFDMFVHMLEDAVKELRGEVIEHDVDTEISFDVEALIPEDYVSDVGVRLSFYKRLASAVDEAHVTDIAAELEDRFGPPPKAVHNLAQVMRLKTELRRYKALGCEATGSRVTLHLRDDTPLDPTKVLAAVKQAKSLYRLTPDMKLTRKFEPPLQSGIQAVDTVLRELVKFI
jgi:transcription-repair coupling factor (superfamily II helicase)